MLDGEIVLFTNNTDVPGLKIGQPSFFIETESESKLFEEPTLYLDECFVRNAKTPSDHTWAGAAQALRTWFQYLQAVGVDWLDATAQDRRDYRDAYLSSISPRTGAEYATSTVTTRMSVTADFYRYAARRGWYNGDLGNFGDSAVVNNPPIDSDPLAHTRSPGRLRKYDPDLPKQVVHHKVAPFRTTDLRALLNHVGPQATQRGRRDRRSSRDRLIMDFGWAVGLRVDEVSSLTTLQFLSVTPDPRAPHVSLPLTIKGKGKKIRTIGVPAWLVLDVLAYCDGEREQALQAAGSSSRTKPTRLFLGHAGSTRSGKPISTKRIQGIIEEACIAIGLVETKSIIDPETGEETTRKKAKHSFHDLRHTYACYTYFAERRMGNAEPWKKIQAQLGHAHLQTTINTYLRHVELFSESNGLNDLRKMIGL